MQISLQSEEGDIVHVQLKGEITQGQLGAADDPLQDLLGDGLYDRKVLLNMAAAEFVDSCGLSWLLICHKRFREGAGQMILYSVPQMVLNVIKILKMDQLFEIADNQKDANRMAGGQAA